MATQEYSFNTKTRLVVGPGALRQLKIELSRQGGKRALLVTDRGLMDTEIPARVQAALGDRLAGVYGEAVPDGSIESVEAGAARAREAGADSLVSLGGGSAMDTAKAIGILLKKGGRLMDYLSPYSVRERLNPHIALPTTAGTGSEVTFVAVVKNAQLGLKMGLVDGHLIPEVAILDPELSVGLGPRLTAATGMDALVHAIEALTSTKRNPMSEMLALGAIRLIRDWLPRAVAEGTHLEARQRMLEAATAAGWAFSNALVGIVHAMAHVVGARHGVHHGTANAILLPACMRYNLEACAPGYAQAARIFDPALIGRPDNEAAAQGIEAIDRFGREIGIPRSLREVGVPAEALPVLAPMAMADPSLFTTPRPIADAAALEAIFRQAW